MKSRKEIIAYIKRHHLLNIIGIVLGFGILLIFPLFCIWQLDIIVSGPVWWESSPTGAGWCWHGPGAYQRAYFQCFFWKTTVGVAYDTLFFVLYFSIIVGSVILFYSVWKWE